MTIVTSTLAFLSIQARISYENPGVRLGNFLKEFSRLTSDSYGCAPELKDEDLAAAFTNQPADQIRSQLEKVVHASWSRGTTGWIIQQTPTQRQEELQWNAADRWGPFKENVDTWRALDSGKEWNAADAKAYMEDARNSMNGQQKGLKPIIPMEMLWQRSPCGRLMTDFCKLADFSHLNIADLENQSPIITAGNIEQLGISKQTMERMVWRFDREETLREMVHPPRKYEPRGPYEFEFVIQKGETVTAELKLFGNRGFNSDSAFISSRKYQRYTPDPEIYKPSNLCEQLGLGLHAYSSNLNSELNQDAVNLAQFVQRNTYKTAEITDPLGVYDGRCWIDCANDKQMPLLVNLTEDSFYQLPSRVPSLVQTHSTVGMLRIDSDGWLLGRPINPIYNRRWRPTRSIYKLIKFDEQTMPTGSKDDQVRNRFLHFQLGGSRSIGRYDLPALYGSCDRTAQAKLRSGLKLSINQLSKEIRLALSSAMIAGELNELGPHKKWFQADSNMVTKCLPNGITDLEFSAPERIDPVFYVLDRGEHGVVHLRDFIRDVAQEMQMDDHWAESKSTMKFKIGFAKAIYLTLSRGNQSIRQVLTDPPSSFSKVVTWKTMPREIRNKVLQGIKDDENGIL